MATHIGLRTVTLQIGGARSLKEKRQVVKSLLDRLRADFNLSVTEADAHDSHQRAVIALAGVSVDPAHLNAVLDKALDRLLNDPRVVVVSAELEMW